MLQVIYHPEAEAELNAATNFYDRRVPGLGADFLAEIDHIVARILETPTRWRIFEEDIRICSLKRFPFTILYRLEMSTVRILAIKHHKQHPDYWKHRKRL